MSGNRFKLGLFIRSEWLAKVPRACDGRNDPEGTFGVTHNPLLRRPLYKQGHSCDHVFSSDEKGVLLKPASKLTKMIGSYLLYFGEVEKEHLLQRRMKKSR